LTAQSRSRREQVRLQAAEMFAQDSDAGQIARPLRVSTKSVYQWRRAWRADGEAALASKGPGGNPRRLDDGQIVRLRAALEAGPAAYGWDQDQRWTLARVAALVKRLARGCLLRRRCLGLGEITKLPQAVVLGQFWFGCERGPVDEAAQREAGAVKPLALFEAGHIE
jgi:transposase